MLDRLIVNGSVSVQSIGRIHSPVAVFTLSPYFSRLHLKVFRFLFVLCSSSSSAQTLILLLLLANIVVLIPFRQTDRLMMTRGRPFIREFPSGILLKVFFLCLSSPAALTAVVASPLKLLPVETIHKCRWKIAFLVLPLLPAPHSVFVANRICSQLVVS